MSQPKLPSPQSVEQKSTSDDDGLQLNFGEQARCDLLYGESGVGKTENLGLAAKYVWEKFGKTSRLVSADGGGWKCLQPYIDLGIIEPLSINAVKTPLKIMFALVRGYWPEERDGRKVYVPLNEKVLEGSDGKPGVGGMMFEGMTSWADAIMMNLLRRKDIHIPETPKESFVKDGEDYWGFSGRAHFGFVQNRVQEIISIANGLPFEKIVWTALEERGTDPETGEPCYGPKIIGKASTGKSPSWFGDCIHLEAIKSDEGLVDDKRPDLGKAGVGGVRKKFIRAYLANHPDPKTGIMYKAKGRSSAWKSKDAIQFFDVVIDDEVQKGLNWIYEHEDKMAQDAAELIAKKLKRPPPKVEFARRGRGQIVVPAMPVIEDVKLDVEDETLAMSMRVANELAEERV